MKCIRLDSPLGRAMEDLEYNSEQIAQITDKIDQKSFTDWYAKGERDSFGYPRPIKNLYLKNDKGEQITINNLLNDEFFEKRQFYKQDLSDLDKIDKFLENEKIGIVRRIANFKGTDYADRLKRLLEELNKLDKNDYVLALEKHTEYITKTVSSLELRFENNDRLRTKEERYKKLKNHKVFLKEAANFLSTFSKVRNLDLPINESDPSYPVIKQLKDIESRVTALQNRVYSEIESNVRNTLGELISNPDVKNGVIDFLAAQTDESKTQLMLDALGDSHITFIAAVDKFFKRAMYEKDQEVKKLNKEWDDFTKSIPDFDSFLDRVLEKENGDKTGKFIPEFNKEYYTELFNFRNKLSDIEDKNSPQYQEALDQYYTWKKENTEQKYVKQYYDDLNLLIPEAREAKEKIDTLKSDILASGSQTIEDFEILQDLDNQMKSLRSTYDSNGKKKTGKDLDIANSLNKFSETMSKYYIDKGVRLRDFNRAKRSAEEKGELEDFLKFNTREEYSQEFWDKFNALVSQTYKSEELLNIEKEIKEFTIKYKNNKGEIKVNELSKEAREELDNLFKQKETIKKTSPKQEKEVYEEFSKLVKFVETSEYLKTLAEKKNELAEKKITKDEYNRWVADNHNFNPYTGSNTPISIWTVMKPVQKKYINVIPTRKWHVTAISEEYNNPKYILDVRGYPPPTDKWLNKDYVNLSQEDKNNLKEVQNKLIYLVDHTKNTAIHKGYLPTIPKDDRSSREILTGKKKVSKKDFPDKAITETEEIVKLIPFKYVSTINTKNSEKLPEITADMSPEQVEETKKERERITAKNRKIHGEAVNYDLKNTMKSFIQTALTNKYKTEIEDDIKLFQEQMKHQKVKKTDAKGGKIFDKYKGLVTGNKEEHEVSAVGSNMQKHFTEWMEGVFYEDWESDEGLLSEWASKLINFSSLRSLGFNVLSSLNNKIVGNIMERIESAGGIYFNYSDYRKARTDYFRNIHHFIANHKTKTSDNFHDAFNKYFDILVSQDELALKPDGKMKTIAHKLAMVKDAAYFGQHVGEHQVQNSTLYAMSLSHRVVDGKIINFNEFFEKKQIKINYEKKMTQEETNQALADIQKNYELREALTEEFKAYPTVKDAYEVKDGYLNKKDNIEIDKDEVFNFRERVIGINQRLHGIYNTEDAATIQRNALGRLAMQFRKWMRPGWNRRFGRRFGKTDYNERVRDYDQGMYIAAFKFVSNPFVQTYKQYKDSEEKAAIKAYRVIVEGFKDLIFNSKIRWHSMSELERSNVKKTAIEMLFLVSVIMMGFLLKKIKGGDDDKFLTWGLYQADRLFGELSVYTPFGIVREGNRLFKSPSPVFSLFEDIIKLLFNILLYPFRDEEERTFKSGIYHGEDKVNIYLRDMIPVYTQIEKIKYMNENTQKYGMFK